MVIGYGLLVFVRVCSGETEVPFGRLWFPFSGLVVGFVVVGVLRFWVEAKRNGGGVWVLSP